MLLNGVRHGYWCFVEYPDGYYHWECSECNKWFKEDSMSLSEEWKYCPNCGAKMDEIEERLIMPKADGSTIPKDYVDEVTE